VVPTEKKKSLLKDRKDSLEKWHFFSSFSLMQTWT